ncbi:hypothetical protein R69619_00413 [Paraburkholderia nemoris]|uniref:hypothetical protein n=1 Tax=Paraburkholderia nemoris TaxID=2793076 RepID=UPI00190E435F|nr:hypothetical protein [Paraburkholderia nemoris]MBK3737675.1 hypothetical protein [Paraburkholderia aspalathi]CAE6694537.1 hypothetical protein R69619_00413 [Paraburkholderia nemoris]
MKAQPTTTTDEQEIGDLQNSIISAFSYAGFAITTATGESATLAVLDKDGNVIDAGPSVSIAAWNVAIKAYRNFLQGAGHLRVHTSAPGIGTA